MFCVGQNPTVGSANSKLMRQALAKLDWLVVRDFQPIESAHVLAGLARTRDRRGPRRGHPDRGVLPALRRPHREGRLLHQHPATAAVARKGVRAARRCRSELHWIYDLGNAMRAKLACSEDPRDRPILELTWDYPLQGTARGARCRGGAAGDQRRRLPTASRSRPTTTLKDDGSTSCGSWIHCGIYKDGDEPAGAQAARDRAELDRT